MANEFGGAILRGWVLIPKKKRYFLLDQIGNESQQD
jgi:hypothetical protein